jgi:CTP:molybdopterin cytidylyltransferase MocA
VIPPGTAAVILAAGASSRLGQPKQLVEIGGETLLERVVRAAEDAGCWPVVVVLGAQARAVLERRSLGSVAVLVNPWWQEGMASSLRLGVAAVSSWNGVVLMTCDQPTVTAEHIQALTASGDVSASAYAGRRGVPAYFPAASFTALLQLTGDSGARDLLKQARTVDLPGGELDIDTPVDLIRARDRMGEPSEKRAKKSVKY